MAQFSVLVHSLRNNSCFPEALFCLFFQKGINFPSNRTIFSLTEKQCYCTESVSLLKRSLFLAAEPNFLRTYFWDNICRTLVMGKKPFLSFVETIFQHQLYCIKSAHIPSYSGPHFPALGLNTERYYSIQSECGKMRTRITPNTDTFCAVLHFFSPLETYFFQLKLF